MKDSILQLALTTHEDGLCPGCGQPRDRSWNEDMEGYYTAHTALCQGCQAASLHIDGHGQLKSAETVYVVDDTPDGYVPDPRMMPQG